MQAQTLVQVNALVHVLVTALTAPLIAVKQPKRCPVVPSGHDALVFGDDGSVASLHTV